MNILITGLKKTTGKIFNYTQILDLPKEIKNIYQRYF